MKDTTKFKNYTSGKITLQAVCLIFGHRKVKGRVYLGNTYSVSKCKTCGVGLGRIRAFLR